MSDITLSPLAHFQGMDGTATRERSAYRTVRLSIGNLHKASPVLYRPSRRRRSQQICRVFVLPILRGLSLRDSSEQCEARDYDVVTRWLILGSGTWFGVVRPEQGRISLHCEVNGGRFGGTYCGRKGRNWFLPVLMTILLVF